MSAEQRPDGPFGARAEREKGLPANYGGATPEEVARAVLRYRPGATATEEGGQVAVSERKSASALEIRDLIMQAEKCVTTETRVEKMRDSANVIVADARDWPPSRLNDTSWKLRDASSRASGWPGCMDLYAMLRILSTEFQRAADLAWDARVGFRFRVY